MRARPWCCEAAYAAAAVDSTAVRCAPYRHMGFSHRVKIGVRHRQQRRLSLIARHEDALLRFISPSFAACVGRQLQLSRVHSMHGMGLNLIPRSTPFLTLPCYARPLASKRSARILPLVRVCEAVPSPHVLYWSGAAYRRLPALQHYHQCSYTPFLQKCFHPTTGRVPLGG